MSEVAKTTGKVTGWVKKHAVKLVIGAVLVAAAVMGWKYAMPFKYVDVSKYSIKQRRAMVAELKKIEGDAAVKKALEDSAKTAKVTYRKALEEAAFAAWKAANPTEVK